MEIISDIYYLDEESIYYLQSFIINKGKYIMATLRVRNFDGFDSLEVVNKEYILNNESFSIYYGQEQIARISVDMLNGDQRINVEIFNKTEYLANIEQINAIIALV